MGSAASIKLNDELQSLYNDINEINKLLIINDLKILKEQQSFTFKKHKDIIIKILTNRGKDYLYQLTKEFDRIEYNKLLGDNQYCNFLYLLSKSSYEIDLLVIEIAVNGVGISELTMCNILSVMNKYELKDLCNGYYEKNNRNLIDVVKGKVNKDSVIATFFDLILKCDRDESENVNELNVSNTVTELHSLLSGFICSRDQQNKVISILCNENRKQCHAISLEYMQKYKKSLDSVITSVFSKALALGINAYCCENSIEASAFILNTSSDSKLYEYYVARLEKSSLEKIDINIKNKFNQKLTGNLKAAVETYMENSSKTPDGGNLDYLNNYLKESRLKIGVSVNTFLSDPNSEQYIEVKSFLQKAVSSLHQYLGDQQDVKPVSTEMKASKIPPVSKKNSKTTESYEEKEKLMTDYLRLQFDTYDTTGEGVLSTDDFWLLMDQLPMDFLGFTKEEVKMMQEFCDWDQDGSISFDEIIGELSEALITAMDSNMEQGTSFKDKINVLYQMMSDGQNNSKSDQNVSNNSNNNNNNNNNNNDNIAPDLKKYLKDSFQAYDVDKNGSLDYNEFWNLLQAMNLGIGESDYSAVMQKWDGDDNGFINWSEAIEQFTKLINDLASDQRDHYIGLVDQNSNCLFWYNIRDQLSTWMSEEDMAMYGPKVKENESVTTSVIAKKR